MGFLHRNRSLTPYLLLAPGLLYLALFFLVPLGFLAYQSLQSGTFDVGYAFDWAWDSDRHVQASAKAIHRFRYQLPGFVMR